MREWVAAGLMTVGALIALASAIRVAAAYLRYFRSRKARPVDRRDRAVAGLELAYSGALNAVLFGGGLVILVGGAVVASLMQRSLLWMPIGLIVAGLVNVGFIRRTLNRVRNSPL